MAFNIQNIKDKVSQKLGDAKETVSKKLDDTFVSKKTFNAKPALVPIIADRILERFKADRFEVNSENTDGTITLYLTKGDLFRTIAGLKTGLVVKISPVGDNQIDIVSSIDQYKGHGMVSASGVAGFLVALPLALPAIIGTVKQAHLDEKPIEIATDVILNSEI